MRFCIAVVLVSGFPCAALASETPSVTSFDSLEAWSEDGPELAGFGPANFLIQGDQLDAVRPAGGTSTSFTGGSQWWAWSMASTSVGGLLDAEGGRIASQAPGAGIELSLTAPSSVPGAAVHGIGGDFKLLSVAGLPQAGSLILTLSDGTAAVFEVSAAGAFHGFWTEAPITITGITIQPDAGSAGLRVSVDNLFFGLGGAVPAPGAIALLAAAGLVSMRRRR